jgi:hypothetical protein
MIVRMKVFVLFVILLKSATARFSQGFLLLGLQESYLYTLGGISQCPKASVHRAAWTQENAYTNLHPFPDWD